MINIVKKYLAKNQYANLTGDFEELFLSHPNYPSLFAITDSLNVLAVENIAIKIPKEQFVELPDSFLAIFKQDLVLVLKKEDSVIVQTDEGKKEKYTFNEFLTHWNEVVIAVEPNTATVTKRESESEKWALYSLPVLALIIMALLFNNYSLNGITLLVTSILGLLVSVFIVAEKFGFKNETVSKFCAISSNTSCDSVIKSDKSELNKWVGFSDLPLLFFGVSVLTLLLEPKSSLLVGGLSLLAFPVIAYSIWLQQFKLKKWCVLCLGISLIIFVQGIVFWFSNPFFSDLLSINYFGFILSLFLFSSAWLFFRPVLEDKIKAENEVNEMKKFKRNYSIFNHLTEKIQSLADFDKLEGLRFGNREAATQLTIIISPSCGHCHTAFEEAFELVTKFPQKVFLNVLFNINPENTANPYRIVVESLLAINNLLPEKVEEAIKDWHIKKMELEDWKKKWIVEFIDMKTTQQIHQQYKWCLENEFNYTPVKIINNKLFPEEYGITDLKYFLNEISEENEIMENPILVEA